MHCAVPYPLDKFDLSRNLISYGTEITRFLAEGCIYLEISRVLGSPRTDAGELRTIN